MVLGSRTRSGFANQQGGCMNKERMLKMFKTLKRESQQELIDKALGDGLSLLAIEMMEVMDAQCVLPKVQA